MVIIEISTAVNANNLIRMVD